MIRKKECKQDGCIYPAWSGGFCKYHAPKKVKQVKRAPLKKISDKRKAQVAVYSLLKKQFLKDNPKCLVTGKPSTQIHHINHREGERLNDTRYWMAVSQEGHDYIHANPKESYEKGWLIKG